ncbi:MAG: hypothetical protein ACK4ZY_02485, partial [Sphingomonas sp.]
MFACLAGLGSTLPAAAQTHVENIATLTFKSGGADQVVRSNAVALDTERTKRPTSFTFRLLPDGYVPTGMRCEGNPPRFTPAPIDAETLAAAPPLAAVDVTSPLIMVIDAEGNNRDPLVRETVFVDFDTGRLSGKLPLLETGANTGVFAGAVPAANDTSDPNLAPCSLKLKRGDRLRLSFTEDEFSYGSEIDLLIDPAGYVFDSRTGEVVDGAQVTLLDESGQPATVFGDDGISRYPATVTSGAAVT